jgi:hypothetical protein
MAFNMNSVMRRRTFLTVAASVTGLLALVGGDAHPATSDPDAASDASEQHYKLTWTYEPDEEAMPDGTLRVPIPTRSTPGQSARYEVSGARSHKLAGEANNEYLLVTPNDLHTPVTVTAWVTLRPYRPPYRDYDPAQVAASLPASVLPYLRATDRIDPDSPRIRALAEPLRGETTLATIRNVLRYLGRTVRYDRRKAAYHSADEIAARGAGDCGCYSALFVALCRANDIPRREVWGVARSFDRRARNPKDQEQLLVRRPRVGRGVLSRSGLAAHRAANVFHGRPAGSRLRAIVPLRPAARQSPARLVHRAERPPARVERVRSLPDMPVRDAAVSPG